MFLSEILVQTLLNLLKIREAKEIQMINKDFHYL